MMTLSGSSPNAQLFTMVLRQLDTISQIGAKVQLQPTAFASIPPALAILRTGISFGAAPQACSGAIVVPPMMDFPAPFSMFAAINNGTFEYCWNKRF